MSDQQNLVCPGCNSAVDVNLSISCDLCGRGLHSSCAGLTSGEAASFRIAHRRSPHLKLLCVNCIDVFQTPPFSPTSNNFSDVSFERNLFLKYVRIMLNDEIAPLKEKISAMLNSPMHAVTDDSPNPNMQEILNEIQSLRSEVNNLKASNLDLLKLSQLNLCVSNPQANASPEPTNKGNSHVSYASKLSAQSSKLVIKPKNPDHSVSQTKSDILKNVNLADENIIIDKVKPVSSGGLMIECHDQLGGDKFKQLANTKFGEMYEVRAVRPYRPAVRFVGLSKEITKDMLANYIVKQNPTIFGNSPWCRVLRHWCTFNNKDVFQADVEIDLDVYNKLLQLGQIIIGVNSCKIYDAISVPRCRRCNGFFHNDKQCKRAISCPICAGEHHVGKCSVPKEERRCSNCVSLKSSLESMSNNRTININHAAWEGAKCEAYSLALEKFRGSFMGKTSKN